VQVQHQHDCDALCECSHTSVSGIVLGCSGHSSELGRATEYCTCTACEVLGPANQESDWVSLAATLPAQQMLLDVQAAPNRTVARGRRLQQLSTTAALQASVDALSSVQDSLVQHVGSPILLWQICTIGKV
jgi:hypothetical protein